MSGLAGPAHAPGRIAPTGRPGRIVMAEKIDRANAVETSPEKDVGAGEGGADASGAGNILAGMQPSTEKESGTERRHD